MNSNRISRLLGLHKKTEAAIITDPNADRRHIVTLQLDTEVLQTNLQKVAQDTEAFKRVEKPAEQAAEPSIEQSTAPSGSRKKRKKSKNAGSDTRENTDNRTAVTEQQIEDDLNQVESDINTLTITASDRISEEVNKVDAAGVRSASVELEKTADGAFKIKGAAKEKKLSIFSCCFMCFPCMDTRAEKSEKEPLLAAGAKATRRM